MSVGVRQRLRSTSLQIFPMVACVVGVVLIVLAGFLAFVDRGLPVDAPVPEPANWFAAVQSVSAIVWLVAGVSLMQRRDLPWSRLAAVVGLSHALAAVSYGWAVHGLVGGTTRRAQRLLRPWP